MSVPIHQIEEKLNSLPNKIRKASEEYIEAKAVTENTKITLKIALAEALIEAKGANAGEKQAKATLATEDEQRALVFDQKAEALAEAGVEYLKNRFDSIKKIANMETEMMRLNISGS